MLHARDSYHPNIFVRVFWILRYVIIVSAMMSALAIFVFPQIGIALNQEPFSFGGWIITTVMVVALIISFYALKMLLWC